MRRVATVICILVLLLVSAVCVSAEKLVVFTMPHIGNPVWYQAGADAFTAKNPGLEAEVVTGWLDKVITMVAAGTPPDLITYSSSELKKLVPHDIVADLSTFASKDPSFRLDSYFPPALEALKYRGTLYGLPRQWSVVGLLYNRDRLDERGVTYPDESWTWEDLVRNGKKLTIGEQPDGTFAAYAFADSLTSHHRQPIWVLEAGGKYWDETYSRSLLNSPQAEQGLQFFVDMILEHNIAPVPEGAFQDLAKAFQEGAVAMTHNTRFGRPSNPNFHWGVAPVVRGPAGRFTLTIVDFVSISSATKNSHLAWELAKFYCSEAGFQAGMELEPRQGYFWGLSPFRRQALRQLEADRDYGDHYWLTLLELSQPAPSFHPSGVNAVPDLRRVVSGELTLRALLDESVRQWNQQIDEAKAKGLKW